MPRHCARPSCASAASTTLTYDYGASTVWLDHLADEPHPMTHDLCVAHADALSVPRGWVLQDRRSSVTSLFSEARSLAS